MAAVVVAGCGGGEGDDDGGGSSSDDSTTTTVASTTTTLSESEEVEAAFLAFDAMLHRLRESPNPDDPEIAERASGETLAGITDSQTTMRTLGETAVFGERDAIHVLEVEFDDADDGDWCSSARVEDMTTMTRRRARSVPFVTTYWTEWTLVRVDGTWMVDHSRGIRRGKVSTRASEQRSSAVVLAVAVCAACPSAAQRPSRTLSAELPFEQAPPTRAEPSAGSSRGRALDVALAPTTPESPPARGRSPPWAPVPGPAAVGRVAAVVGRRGRSTVW